ncbi:MAG: carboxypeptidase regulatory-like domain-containing protein [Nitrospinae bacterium]|nr:carboxypeptidase regulatory-like domain-containing protein [Nitrospinota bacterium]
MIRLLPMALRSRIRSNCKRQNEDCKLQIVNCKNHSKVLLYFAFLILHFAFFNAPALAATLTGRVEIVGSYNIKPRKNLDEQIKAERSLIVSKDGGIKDAVVFIKGINLSSYVPDQKHIRTGLKREETSSLIQKEVVIDQKRKAFIPHAFPVIVGAKVTFKNSDPFVHRIISNSEEKKLRMEFAYEGATMDVTFDKPGIIELWCDDHKRMQGWILVMETPFFAATDEKGYFTIPDVPVGRYTVEVWHEVLGIQNREIEIKAGENSMVDFKLPGKEF